MYESYDSYSTYMYMYLHANHVSEACPGCHPVSVCVCVYMCQSPVSVAGMTPWACLGLAQGVIQSVYHVHNLFVTLYNMFWL